MNPMNKKKSTPEGAPLTQLNGTTFEQKSEAEMLFDKIGEGVGHAVKRPKDPKTDRQLRKLVADANGSGNDCIINVGFGYYRPGDDDSFEFELYIAGERSRAKEILRKCRRMEEVYDRRYQ